MAKREIVHVAELYNRSSVLKRVIERGQPLKTSSSLYKDIQKAVKKQLRMEKYC